MLSSCLMKSLIFFFFNDTATTEIYTLSLHDALPISERAVEAGGVLGRVGQDRRLGGGGAVQGPADRRDLPVHHPAGRDRKSTRLNSSHANISYAVFCLKKK